MSDQKKRSRGLGDTVKKAIEITTFGMVKQKPGCGCAGRQAWLNKKFPYKWYREALKRTQESNRVDQQQKQIDLVRKTHNRVTEEILTPEQKKMRDELVKQRLARLKKTPASPKAGTPASKGEAPKKKCAPCEKARLERERLAKEKLEKEQEG